MNTKKSKKTHTNWTLLSLTCSVCVSQLFADHSGVSGVPTVITHCPPLIIDAQFHSTLELIRASNQTNITISTVSSGIYYRMWIHTPQKILHSGYFISCLLDWWCAIFWHQLWVLPCSKLSFKWSCYKPKCEVFISIEGLKFEFLVLSGRGSRWMQICCKFGVNFELAWVNTSLGDLQSKAELQRHNLITYPNLDIVLLQMSGQKNSWQNSFGSSQSVYSPCQRTPLHPGALCKFQC